MKRIPCWLAWCLLLACGRVFAATGFPLLYWPDVPDPQQRPCDDTLVRTMIAASGKSSEQAAGERKSVCKTWSQHPDLDIVAIAEHQPTQSQFGVLIGLWNRRLSKLIAYTVKDMEEDAALTFQQMQLRVDTARYDFALGTEGFGIDVDGGYQAHCSDATLGAARSLFAFDGRSVRMVAEDIILGSVSIVSGDRGRCSAPGGKEYGKPTVMEQTRASIAVARTISNGFRDLLISEQVRRSDGIPLKVSRYRMKFDGKNYRRATARPVN